MGAGSLWPPQPTVLECDPGGKILPLGNQKKKIGAVTCGKDGFERMAHSCHISSIFFLKSPYLDHWFLAVTTHYYI